MPPDTSTSVTTNGLNHRSTLSRGLMEDTQTDLPQQSQQQFMWAVGIESSTLPHLNVDQFNWTGHNDQWQDDIKLVSQGLGLKHLRYSIPWHYIEPSPGQYNWSIADERLGFIKDQGIEVMMDVMHFGTPQWLGQAVGDPEFPEALERLTQAMVERYSSQIRTWCPVNEPLVTSLFSGDFGFWPPHARKWRGYMPVLTRVAMATSRAIRAIRNAQPDASVLICDAADHFMTRDESLKSEVTLRNLRRFLLLDLIMGKVDTRHPLFNWVTAYGMSEMDIQWFASNRQMPDLLGLDYYPHSDWQLERNGEAIRQRRADSPAGLHGVATDYFNRYGLPMLVTETSIEGKPINREVWLEQIVADIQQLRSEGIPLAGLVWWPLFDHLDWDGAMTHRIGKLHQVGLYKLVKQADGQYARVRTPMADVYQGLASQGDEAAGQLGETAIPTDSIDDQQLPLADFLPSAAQSALLSPTAALGSITSDRAKTNGHGAAAPSTTAVTGRAGQSATASRTSRGQYGIIVFSHLRWGFVWQRPQQFLSRFARKHSILFVEEPIFDLPNDATPRTDLHQVMPNVTVVCAHCPRNWAKKTDIADFLRLSLTHAIEQVNRHGAFDRPVLWYYSPMDAAWSLGHFANRGVVYDCMDELSQFTGAPPQLIDNERRLMEYADIVFTGGKELWAKKKQSHQNVHFFGCGVESDHFGQAMESSTTIPPDIDFLNKPVIGWFGVIDERVDYHLVAEMARLRPDWSFAMVGPIVKVDPNLIPHAPNLYWLGGRDYSQLPNYCKAFDVCMMCFAINDATQYINPTKAMEYLATGKPVIATPVRDVVSQYSDLMDIGSTAQELVDAAERAWRNPDQDRIRRGLELARSNSWENTVASMQKLILSSISQDDRPSSRTITPLSSEELSYQFISTPGS